MASGAAMMRWLGAALLLTAAALAAVAVQRSAGGLEALVPRGDPALARQVDFFNGLARARVMVVEAEAVAPGADPVAALALAAAELAPVGARPATAADAAAAARLHQRALDHLGTLLAAEDLERLAPDLEPAALAERAGALRRRVQRPDDPTAAALVRADPLGLAGPVLAGLQPGPAGARPAGPGVLHRDGVHALMECEVAFPPEDLDRTRRLAAAVDRAAAAARDRGVALRWTGSHRHYLANADTVRADLLTMIPLEILVVGAVLWTLVRSWRALAAIHVPAAASVLGCLAGGGAWSLLSGHSLPTPLLAMIPVVLGIAVDYGSHAVSAALDGRRPLRELLTGCLAAVVAAACLGASAVPGLACIGAMLAGGLVLAAFAALAVTPAVAPDPAGARWWAAVARPLYAWLVRRPRLLLLAAAAATVAALPGLARIEVAGDLRRLDGSGAAAWADQQAISERWGAVAGAVFLVGEGSDPIAAVAALRAARRSLGLAPGALDRLLPDAAEAAARQRAWDAFWGARMDLPQRFADACAAAGLRAEALAPALARCRPGAGPGDAPGLSTWEGTAVAPLLGRLRQPAPAGWRAVAPLPLAAAAAQPLAAQLPAGGPAWIASRLDLGRGVVAGVRDDLLLLAPLVLVAVALALLAVLRSLRALGAVLLPPLTGLLWTAGLHGWAAVPITPLSVLVTVFVLGIGIDAAVFLRAGRWSLPAVLAAWATTVLGTASLLIAEHPVVRGLGVSLTLGLTAAFIATLLITPALAPDRETA